MQDEYGNATPIDAAAEPVGLDLLTVAEDGTETRIPDLEAAAEQVCL